MRKNIFYLYDRIKNMNDAFMNNLLSLGSLIASLIGGSIWIGALHSRVKSLEQRQVEIENWKTRIENKIDRIQQEMNKMLQETNLLIHDCKNSILMVIKDRHHRTTD